MNRRGDSRNSVIEAAVPLAMGAALLVAAGLVSGTFVSADETFVCPPGTYDGVVYTYDPPGAAVVEVGNWAAVWVGVGVGSGSDHVVYGDGVTEMNNQVLPVSTDTGQLATDAHLCKPDETPTTSSSTTTSTSTTSSSTTSSTTTSSTTTSSTTTSSTTTSSTLPPKINTTTTTISDAWPPTTTSSTTTSSTMPSSTLPPKIDTTTTLAPPKINTTTTISDAFPPAATVPPPKIGTVPASNVAGFTPPDAPSVFFDCERDGIVVGGADDSDAVDYAVNVATPAEGEGSSWSVIVTARPEAGTEFRAGATTEWSYTGTVDCEEPMVAQMAVPVPESGAGRTMADTGSEHIVMLMLGTLLIGAGFAAVRLARRDDATAVSSG